LPITVGCWLGIGGGAPLPLQSPQAQFHWKRDFPQKELRRRISALNDLGREAEQLFTVIPTTKLFIESCRRRLDSDQRDRRPQPSPVTQVWGHLLDPGGGGLGSKRPPGIPKGPEEHDFLLGVGGLRADLGSWQERCPSPGVSPASTMAMGT
jgi:hypothetical protein